MQPKGPLVDFARKCKAAYEIFFPPRPKSLSPKEQGRNRLRMILVADRCAMNTNSLVEMKTSIVNAVSNYVEVRNHLAVFFRLIAVQWQLSLQMLVVFPQVQKTQMLVMFPWVKRLGQSRISCGLLHRGPPVTD